MVKEEVAFVLAAFLVLKLVGSEFSRHLVLELSMELSLDVSNGYFIKSEHSQGLSFIVEILELILVHGGIAGKVLHEVFLEDSVTFFYSLLTLVFTDVTPGALDGGNGTSVDSRHVTLSQVIKHLTVKFAPIKRLGLDSLNHLVTQVVNLLGEFRSELV